MQSAWLQKTLEHKDDLQGWSSLDLENTQRVRELQTTIDELRAAHAVALRDKDEENQRALTLMQEPWIELHCAFEYHNSSVKDLEI